MLRYAMTIQPDNTLISNREMLLELASKPFRAIGSAIHWLAENNARMQAVNAISSMTDAELAAKGLTRAEAVGMVFRRDA